MSDPATKERHSLFPISPPLRVLVENDYAGFTEDQVLHQIFIDEQFPVEDTAAKAKEEKQKLASSKAAIGYDYNEVGIRFQSWVSHSAASGENRCSAKSDLV